MPSRSSNTPAAPGQPGTARKAAARKSAAVDAAAIPARDPAERLLLAGLKALGNVRNELVQHHTHAIERLLGIQRSEADAHKPAAPLGFGPLETFGLRKFEDVFDQRVATALQRLGMPSAQELQALRDEVRQLRAQRDAAAASTPAAPAASGASAASAASASAPARRKR